MRRRLPSTPDVAPVPECVRFHVWSGEYAIRGQFPDGKWFAVFALDQGEKAALWAEYGPVITAEAKLKAWRQRPPAWRPWQMEQVSRDG